ncbi:MAG: transglycosylase SLT domain-containing protein [Gammaproteobacteria bacterium]|nr:transglycosylase SLT domain-containing protein [Gammaproteobacteria bacterium]
MTRALLLCISACALWAPVCSSASSFPDRYDTLIERAAERYLPGVDWRLWKAQLYQESLLNPDAVSPAGAAGIAQFMPGTWSQISRELGHDGVSPHMAGPAIDAGAYYMAKLRNGWSSPRPEADRHSLAAASYNAGMGNLIKAQRQCGGAVGYPDIITCLPDVTGHHSTETIVYVQRIWQWWTQMVLGL